VSKESRPWSIWFVAAIFAFLALMALPVGWMMVRSPHGDILGMSIDWIARTPFGSWLMPGLFLFTVIGLGSLCAIYALFVRPGWQWAQHLNPFRTLRWEWTFAAGMGLAAMVWIVVQVLTLRMYFWMQPLIFGLGLAIVLLMVEPHMRRYFGLTVGRAGDTVAARSSSRLGK
jgi:hypothetical protein